MTSNPPVYPMRWYDPVLSAFFRFAASGYIPASWFLRDCPVTGTLAPKQGRLTLEIVSHCWRYANLLAYQLSSLVNYPPSSCDVTMTVFYCPDDEKTAAMLAFFGTLEVPGVRWNWQPLPRESLFRRGIGRNQAARATQADWLWFADCDVIFHDGCLDALAAALQGRTEALLYPREERITSLLAESDPMLQEGHNAPKVIDINGSDFELQQQPGARGAYQIVHGDLARQCGYCEQLRYYQTPSRQWRKTYEDRAFRWLIRDQGTPIDVPAIYRIRHIHKGRYQTNSVWSPLRRRVRQLRGR